MKVFNFILDEKQAEDILVWLNGKGSLKEELQFVAHSIHYSREMIYTMNSYVIEANVAYDETIHEDKKGAEKFKEAFALSMAKGFEDILDTMNILMLKGGKMKKILNPYNNIRTKRVERNKSFRLF